MRCLQELIGFYEGFIQADFWTFREDVSLGWFMSS